MSSGDDSSSSRRHPVSFSDERSGRDVGGNADSGRFRDGEGTVDPTEDVLSFDGRDVCLIFIFKVASAQSRRASSVTRATVTAGT